MEFANQEPDANGQLALALVVALMKRLFPEHLDGSGLAEVLRQAGALLPKGPGRRDVEARQLLEGVRAELGNPR